MQCQSNSSVPMGRISRCRAAVSYRCEPRMSPGGSSARIRAAWSRGRNACASGYGMSSFLRRTRRAYRLELGQILAAFFLALDVPRKGRGRDSLERSCTRTVLPVLSVRVSSASQAPGPARRPRSRVGDGSPAPARGCGSAGLSGRARRRNGKQALRRRNHRAGSGTAPPEVRPRGSMDAAEVDRGHVPKATASVLRSRQRLR